MAVVLVLWCAFWTTLVPRTMAAAEPLEYAVKAAFLSKFGLYVEWPSEAFPSPSSEIRICVLGRDPFGARLDEAVVGQRIGDRALAVRRLETVSKDSHCHILYMGGDAALRAGQTVGELGGSGVLTITDAHEPGAGAGIINFVIKDNRVRFEIDEAAAAQHGLKISSKLLSLALNVNPRR
jgi:hypothetical protein